MAEYIDRILLGEVVTHHGMVHYEDIMSMPTADVVERKVLDQVYWERDTALYQLAEIGKGLGEKMDDVVERKRGEWIWDDEGYHCSECFFHAYGNTGEILSGDYHFCPNCGAEMSQNLRG